MMLPNLLYNQLIKNQNLLYSNNIKLISKTISISLVAGTPQEVVSETEHWSGKGSIQYVRPRIQKSIADEMAGTMEDPVAIVCYLPYDAMPNEGMSVVDVDGVLGKVDSYLIQSRVPANVGGVNVYWEVYIGEAVND